MTETERSLIDAVVDDPDDDLPRLVYADWLDENGEPRRAQLIRHQMSRGYDSWFPTGQAATCYIYPPLTDEQIQSPAANLYTDGVPVILAPAIRDVSYLISRGFPVALSCTMEAMFRADGLFMHYMRDWPIVRVNLEDRDWSALQYNVATDCYEFCGHRLLTRMDIARAGSEGETRLLLSKRVIAAARAEHGRKPLSRKDDDGYSLPAPPADLAGSAEPRPPERNPRRRRTSRVG